MTNKQEKAVQRAVNKEHKLAKVREEKHILWVLLAIIAILLWLLLGQRYGWWPFSRHTLGSAFYTNLSAGSATPDSSASGSDDGGASDDSNSGGSNGGGSGGGGGGGTTTPSGSGSILDFAADVNVGSTKTEIDGHANNLGQNCAVVVSAQTTTSAGKQEVCTYTEGDKIVTVTYLNDRVISASKSGF